MQIESDIQEFDEFIAGEIVDEEHYHILLNDLLKYIVEVKSKQNDEVIPLIDIIKEYAFRRSVSYESLGTAISEDYYLKALLDAETRFNPHSKEILEEW